ncbi:hypothetical protein Ddye_015982 [Dipteronia dyeriana]|uniref:Uncharacterized protein n=1 Tax=Dipteronia dyeriana TaxID=168575 RepID=A0AAD9U6L1_9ROSI|nr:hypothetical protein Ddye_015982 [Dipteronia dyeriana]
MISRLKDLLKTPEGYWFKEKLTRHDHFEALASIDDALNRVPEDFAVEDQRRFMVSSFGHFISMHRELKFSGGVIHQLLLRELDHDRSTDEMRFLLRNHVVRFLKVEFSLITGLRFGVVPGTSLYVTVENEIHQWYFPGHDEILMGVNKRLKIPIWQFRLVEDLNAFNVFPWGAHVYRYSIFSFKHVLPRRREERRQQSQGDVVHSVEGYNIYGLSHAILIFAFEVIPQLGIDFGTRRIIELSPRMLKWELTKQPRGKKLAKFFSARMSARKEIVPTAAEAVAPYFTGLSDGGSLYVQDDMVHPPIVPDLTSSADCPEEEGTGGRKVRFTTTGPGAATRDSRACIGCDEEAPWEHQFNELREALRKSEDDQQQQHRKLLDMIRKSEQDRQQQHRKLLALIGGLQGRDTVQHWASTLATSDCRPHMQEDVHS